MNKNLILLTSGIFLGGLFVKKMCVLVIENALLKEILTIKLDRRATRGSVRYESYASRENN